MSVEIRFDATSVVGFLETVALLPEEVIEKLCVWPMFTELMIEQAEAFAHIDEEDMRTAICNCIDNKRTMGSVLSGHYALWLQAKTIPEIVLDALTRQRKARARQRVE